MHRLPAFVGVPSNPRYGGLTLNEWAPRLHYRNENENLIAEALPLSALHVALNKHGSSKAVGGELAPRQLAAIGMAHPHHAVKLLSVAAVAAGDSLEMERIEALGMYPEDSGLRDAQSPVRLYAAGCLFRMGTMAALSAILDAGPYSSGIERAVIWKMRASKLPDYGPVLARFVERNTGYYKHLWAAVDGLAEIGEPAFELMRGLLHHNSPAVRQQGLGAVFKLKEAAMPLAEDVRALLRDADPGIQCSAASELWRVCGSDEGLPIALALSGHESAAVRTSVAWVLRFFKDTEATALNVLRQFEADPNDEVREVAKLILSK